MKKEFIRDEEAFIKAAFSTDPRVIARAKLKFEVKPDDQKELAVAVINLHGNATRGISPEAEWLKDAEALAERLGKAWDFKNEEAGEVAKQAEHFAAKRMSRTSPFYEVQPLNPASLPSRVRDFVLGIPTTVLYSLSTVKVCIQPEALFRLRRIVLPDEIALFVNIHELKIGNVCQFGNSELIPGSVFSSRAFPLALSCDTAQVNQLITLTVSNWSGSNVMFCGALHGVGIE